MIVHRDILSNTTLDHIHLELNKYRKDMRWNMSDEYWQAEITHMIPGISTCSFASDDTWHLVYNDIKNILPLAPVNAISMQYQMWHKSSGAPIHNDSGYVWAATIYLNREWHIDWGGIFLWVPESVEDGLRGFVPRYNTMAVNESPMKAHMITSVSPAAPENRLTLQLWAA